jgi:hypothetical protein
MTFVRNLLRDLVEKRLWPVALALVVVIAAVPVLLGGGGSSTPPAAPVSPSSSTASPTATSAGLLTAGDTTPARRSRGGKLHNPFDWPKPADQSSTTTTGSGVSSAGGSSASPVPSGSGSSGSTGSAVTPTPSRPTTPSTTTSYFSYAITMRFGETGDQKRIKDMARLSVLPSKKNPLFVFLGVREDGRTAAFLMPSRVDAIGDGKCYPSADVCQIIELRAGDTEYFDLMTPSGKLVQYQMDLRSIRMIQVAASKAKTAAARISRAGQGVVRAVSKDADAGSVRQYLGRSRFLPAQL